MVSSSLVLKGGGKAYIRLRAPKYPDSANGVTSIAKEMAMYIPRPLEMAEIYAEIRRQLFLASESAVARWDTHLIGHHVLKVRSSSNQMEREL
jgi:hypothetical protein